MSIATATRAVSSTSGDRRDNVNQRINAFSMRGFGTLFATETKVWMRDLGSPIMGLLFPVMLIAMIGFMGGEDMVTPITTENIGAEAAARFVGTHWYGVSPLAIVLPTFIVWGLCMTALTVMPGTFAMFREKGVLRRFAASPMRPHSLITAHVILNVVVGLVAALLGIAFAHFVFSSVAVPNNVFAVAVGILLGLAAFCAVGAVVGARLRKATVASGIGTVVMFVMAVLSGAFGMGATQEGLLTDIGRFTPMGAVVQILDAGWFGEGFPVLYTLVLVAWIVIPGAVAAKLFKWS